MELFRRHYSKTTRLQQHDAAAAPAGDSRAHHGSSSSSSSKEPGGGVDVQVTVLTQAHWPTQTLLELNLPTVSGWCAAAAAGMQVLYTSAVLLLACVWLGFD
jgi:hypothetical protein